jgi:hypothetical protein
VWWADEGSHHQHIGYNQRGIMKHRVWCKTKNEWERDTTIVNNDGTLFFFDRGRIQNVNMDNHILEYSINVEDKNDKEVYEGDIIKAWSYLEEEYITGEVKIGNRGAWMIKPIGSEGFKLPINTSFFRGISIVPDSDIEIVGNIHI